MIKIILAICLLLPSLLVLFRSPTNLLWYVAILVTEFCWVFVLLTLLLIFWRFGNPHYNWPANVLCLLAIGFYSVPIVQAARLSKKLPAEFAAVFGSKAAMTASPPFRPLQMITGMGAEKIPYTTCTYDSVNNLSLDFYPSRIPGRRPIVIVVHGGSWAGGNSRQLPELNSVLARDGYHVASINYRLAPMNCFPAPVEDVATAIHFLFAKADEWLIDAGNITLLGRSAGGQVVLSAASTLADKRIKGVIAFYGPADMVWGYGIACSPLVLDSRKVMRDYLGGSLDDVPAQYTKSSATETVNASMPPVLLFYAENDPLVSPRHGDRLTTKLQAAGVPHYSLNLPWGTHAFDYTLNGPGGQLSTWAVKQFLKRRSEPRM